MRYSNFSSFKMVSYIFKKAGNQYKKLAYKIGPYNFCQCFDEEKFFVEGMREKSNFPPKGTCPWPKQVYEIDDYIVRFS